MEGIDPRFEEEIFDQLTSIVEQIESATENDGNC
jgi:hypothetical protein